MEHPSKRVRTGYWRDFVLAAGATCVLGLMVVVIVNPATISRYLTISLFLLFGWPLLLGLVVAVLSAFVAPDGAGAVVSVGGGWWYGLLSRLRHPWFWGSMVATVVFAAGLGLFVHYAIDAKRDEAAAQLQEHKKQLLELARENSTLPVANGENLHEALGSGLEERWHNTPFVDPWGEPYRYRLDVDAGGPQVATIRSDGWDRDDPSDDLEVQVSYNPDGLLEKTLDVANEAKQKLVPLKGVLDRFKRRNEQ